MNRNKEVRNKSGAKYHEWRMLGGTEFGTESFQLVHVNNWKCQKCGWQVQGKIPSPSKYKMMYAERPFRAGRLVKLSCSDIMIESIMDR